MNAFVNVDVERGGDKPNEKKRPKKYAPAPGDDELGTSMTADGEGCMSFLLNFFISCTTNSKAIIH